MDTQLFQHFRQAISIIARSFVMR